MPVAPLPLFDKLPAPSRDAYHRFFQMTDLEYINTHTRELDTITALASAVLYVFWCANPILDTNKGQWGNKEDLIAANQWHLDRLSDVKYRLARAIAYKRTYYDNTFLGKVTRFILKLFGLWNYGTTPTIAAAERFLLRFDLRYPIYYRYEDGRMRKAPVFWSLKSPHWIRTNLNVQNFYNYEPRHAVEVIGRYEKGMPRFMVAVD